MVLDPNALLSLYPGEAITNLEQEKADTVYECPTKITYKARKLCNRLICEQLWRPIKMMKQITEFYCVWILLASGLGKTCIWKHFSVERRQRTDGPSPFALYHQPQKEWREITVWFYLLTSVSAWILDMFRRIRCSFQVSEGHSKQKETSAQIRYAAKS